MSSRSINRRLLVLQAGWTVAQAQLLLAHSQAEYVVIQRTEPQTYWYVYRLEVVQKDLSPHHPDVAIYLALNLQETSASPTLNSNQLENAEYLSVVLDDQHHLQGVINPSAQAKGTEFDPFFKAYPSVVAPNHAQLNQAFDLAVGFRDTPDAGLIGGHNPIVIHGLQVDEQCTIMLSGDGLQFDREQAELAFDMQATLFFKATPTRTGRCMMYVDYYRQRQLVGHAERVVLVDSNAEPEPSDASPFDFGSTPVDLLINLRRDGDTFKWTAMPHDQAFTPVHNLPSQQALSEQAAQNCAVDLLGAAVNPSLLLAQRELEALASDLGQFVPSPIWQLHSDLAQKLQRPLTVLLRSNDLSLPWELAMVEAPLLAGDQPLYWAAQTHFARWYIHPQVSPMPPDQLNISQISAIASRYGWDSGQAELVHAVDEQTMLQTQWQTQAYEATIQALDPLLSQATTQTGHLLHFAVHGRSQPNARIQEIILADNNAISAKALVGNTRRRPPQFSFVFINACQVATPGQSLGQAAGFPAEILKSGAAGFVAPLWEADDQAAGSFAAQFYSQAFQAQPLGAILQQYRLSYVANSTTTRLAYIFYGHPALRLAYSSKGATHAQQPSAA
ncbi:TCAD7 domain-containing protein [Herpetosiphon gulosus]|uniref:CHAT domain-containing protein n=1 Tax=Herpetosiphon gulosus TaxID=1973496 RepID=A0ABP9X561_9CHLR